MHAMRCSGQRDGNIHLRFFSDPFLFQPLRIFWLKFENMWISLHSQEITKDFFFFWPETRDWTWLKPHKGVLFRATVMEMWFDFSYENRDSKNERTEANNPGKRFDHSLAGSMRSVYWWWKRGKTLESRWKTQQNYIYYIIRWLINPESTCIVASCCIHHSLKQYPHLHQHDEVATDPDAVTSESLRQAEETAMALYKKAAWKSCGTNRWAIHETHRLIMILYNRWLDDFPILDDTSNPVISHF